MEHVKSSNLDLVFDKSGASLNGFSPILFSKDRGDFTADVIATLNKMPAPASPSAPKNSPVPKP